MDEHNLIHPQWMKTVLREAAIYNILWGTAAVIFPLAIFQWSGFDLLPRYPQFWQCIGMIVGVYGIGYWLASRDPYTHWPIVLVGLLGKLLGPIGFMDAVTKGALPWAFGWTIICNDIIWWFPFSAILWQSLKVNRTTELQRIPIGMRDALESIHKPWEAE